MPYNINRYNGSLLTTVEDGTVDTTLDMWGGKGLVKLLMSSNFRDTLRDDWEIAKIGGDE
jgi:hypothetical protein